VVIANTQKEIPYNQDLNCAQIVTFGRLGYWSATECATLTTLGAKSTCCGIPAPVPVPVAAPVPVPVPGNKMMMNSKLLALKYCLCERTDLSHLFN
jgi:hypothetical protein